MSEWEKIKASDNFKKAEQHMKAIMDKKLNPLIQRIGELEKAIAENGKDVGKT